MQTHLIYSNTKHGAFVAVLEKLKTNLSSNREQVVIVPDKFSLNAEKFIMEHLGLSATTQINVTSLDRMADIYCKNLNLNYLSKFGGIMLVQKILLDNSKKLNVFKKSYKYSGFCEDLFNNIMLLKSCNVTPQGLLNSAENLDAFSKLKVSEIAFIFQEYENYLQERFYDSANKLTIFKQQMQLDNNFKDVDFYYAMFDDYTPQALSVIETLSKFSHSQTFGLLQNQRKNKWDFFNDIATQKINSIFLSQDTTTTSYFNEYFSSSKNTIQNYIGTKNQNVAQIDGDISFWQANSVQEEIDFLCKSILYRVHNDNTRFKQISVGVGNLENLQAEIEQTFNKYNIPYFIDVSKPLSELMVSKFLFSIFDAIINNYQQKDVIAILKSPFIGVSFEDKQLFENYLIANNIDNEKIFQPFVRGGEDELNVIEPIRLIVCEYIDYFNKNIKNSQKIYDFCQIIKDFFVFFEIENKLNAFCEQINDLGINILSNQNKQCLNGINNILNELQNIFGLTEISFKHFLELFSAGCDSMTVSSAPSSVDQVFIGDSNTSIFGQNDYFYFINCVENFFPVSQNDCGLIVDSEINCLNEKILIEPTIKEINKKSIFNAYNNVFLYQKEIQLSYGLNSLLKEEQKPSSFLLDLLSLFSLQNGQPAGFINIQNYLELDNEKSIVLTNITPYSATKNILKFCGQNIQPIEKIKLFDSILYSLSNNGCYPEIIGNPKNTNIKGAVTSMKQIIDNKQKFSVSQIESYYSCPYMHFAKYILGLKQKPQGIFQAFDIGNFLHKVAELFFKDLIKNKKKYYFDSEIAIKIEKIIEKVENDDYFSIFFKNKEQDLLLIALEKEAIRMCYAFNEQAKHSSFQTAETELSFNISLKELGNNELNIEFYGKVDRLDEFGKHFRIVDYKTGAEKFNTYNLYYGKKIQLHLYAYALQKKRNQLACGIFYSPIKDDYVKEVNETVKQDFYKFDGVLIDDPSLALAQDDTLCLEKLKSDFIPVKFLKSPLEKYGEYQFDSNSKVVTKEEFQSQLHYALLVFSQAIQEIKEGNIEPSPFKDGTMLPCDYCPFSVACGYDEQKGNSCREFNKKLKFDEIFKELNDA